MITVDFSKRKNTPLYEFLYESIKDAVLKGELTADEKLPSQRHLSLHLGISIITVRAAYERLIDEGFIYSIEKKGFYITKLSLKKVFLDTQKIKKEEKQEEIFTDKTKLIDFTSSSITSEKFPFRQWSKIMKNILYTKDPALFESQGSNGSLELRKAIAFFLKGFRNLVVPENQIIIGSGSENLYDIAVKLLGRNNIFAVENPGYKKPAQIISLNGGKCIPVKTDSEGLSVQLLEKTDANIVHVSPSHHFPTGSIMSIKRRMELLEWAYRKKNRFIIEDEYDAEFRFSGKPVPSLRSIDTKGRVIYMNTFSKTLSPSFRLSYMILPDSLIKLFKKKMSFYSCQVPSLEQKTLSEFISGGFYEKHLNRMKNYYRGIRNELILSLEKSPLNRISEIHEEEAGLHFLLKIKTDKSEAYLKKRMEEEGIMIHTLSDFYHTKENKLKNIKCTFIINYTGLNRDKIRLAVEKLSEAVL